MSIIQTTNSDCSIKKIDYLGATAIVYLKITSFARTIPEVGVLIGLSTSEELFIPAFKASSEDDTYNNKIFWINYNSSAEHTNQNIGMETTIPIKIDLTKGIYRHNRLYREVYIVIADYRDESNTLWKSELLHLCSEPLSIDIDCKLTPTFKPVSSNPDNVLYNLTLDYEFSEDSWLFDIKNDSLIFKINISTRQTATHKYQETILPSIKGSIPDIVTDIEASSHVNITASLVLNNITLWASSNSYVPNEFMAIYIKQDNKIYRTLYKSVIDKGFIRDAHAYTSYFTNTGEVKLVLQVYPWLDSEGNYKYNAEGDILFTLRPGFLTVQSTIEYREELMNLLLIIKSVKFSSGYELSLPNNLTGNISEDFPNIIYHNYKAEAEELLSDFNFIEPLTITFSTVKTGKTPVLVANDKLLAGNITVMESSL